MRLCNADVDEAERNPSQFEDFDEPEDDEGLQGLGDVGKDCSKGTSLDQQRINVSSLNMFIHFQCVSNVSNGVNVD